MDENKKYYTAFINNKEDANMLFDNNKFQTYIDNHQYLDAADYANQFVFKDPTKQKAHENDIENLRREGRKLQAIYSRITNDEDKQAIEFYDAIFNDGAIEQLQENNSKNQKTNTYLDDFLEYKKQLGNLPGKDEATWLEIEFKPETRKFLGIDWLAPDNSNTIEAFYNNMETNEQELREQGIEIYNKDGNTYVKFEKSHHLANKIIYNIPTKGLIDLHDLDFDLSSIPNIIGYTQDNKPIKYPSFLENTIRAKHPIGSYAFNLKYKTRPLYNYQQIIKDAKLIKSQHFKGLNDETRYYSSTIGPALFDDLVSLQEKAINGEIKESAFNREFNIKFDYINTAIRSLPSVKQMYANWDGTDKKTESLKLIDNATKTDIINYISSTPKQNLHLNSMVVNGKIGTLITIDAKANSDATSFKDATTLPRLQVFVPNFMQEQVQAKINGNAQVKAHQELNSMIDYQYPYKTISSGTLKFHQGKFYKNNEEIDKSKALHYLAKDAVQQHLSSQLKYAYLNSSNKIINKEAYERKARELAISEINKLYPNTYLVDPEGNFYTISDIFSKTVDINNLTPDQEEKYNDILETYDIIMNALKYYKEK